MNCKICLSEVKLINQEVILDKYRISYFLCDNCGFIQTEEPYWLDEAYSSVITRSDIGLVRRNIMLSKITKIILSVFFSKHGKFIDYGGGYGLYVRLMRDIGFDFSYHDKRCENLFAKDFEDEADGKNRYELLTAFEVFEHLVNPIGEMEKMLAFSKNILFTTVLLPVNTPKPDEWWYYGLDHGQHISFYSRKSLSVIAKKFSLNLYSDRKSLHLLTEKKLSPLLFKMITEVPALLDILFNRSSLMRSDYKKITGKDLY